MDVLFSQYGLLERLRNLLEPQDYINLLRSQNNDGRHKADCTDIRSCLNPVNYLFRTLDPMAAWRTMYGCSFILCGEDLARLHGYLVGDVRGDEAYDLPLIIAFEGLRSYQQALADTLNGAIGDIHDEIERSVRKPIVSLSSGTQTPRATVVRLHLDLQLLDTGSLSFFGQGAGTETISCGSSFGIFVCSHAVEPLLCPRQPLLAFPSSTSSVVLLGSLENPNFVTVRKCHVCSRSTGI